LRLRLLINSATKIHLIEESCSLIRILAISFSANARFKFIPDPSGERRCQLLDSADLRFAAVSHPRRICPARGWLQRPAEAMH
jgi:hypothetical protein